LRLEIAFGNLIKELNIRVLPNTAGCHTAKEAITTAMMPREIFGTDWINWRLLETNTIFNQTHLS